MLNLSVDILHWLDEIGCPAEPVRRKALWVARMIEYGGPLEAGFMRHTLIECTMRPKRRPCLGLLWVTKRADDRIEAWCGTCHELRVIVSGWRETDWADGVMEPMHESELDRIAPTIN
jgi:hypothetical protein